MSQAAIFLFPLGVLLVCVMVRWTSEQRELLGLLAGAGCAAGVIGLLNLNDGGCSTHEDALTTTITCGGFDGKPWLAAGVVMVAGAALAYLRVGRNSAI